MLTVSKNGFGHRTNITISGVIISWYLARLISPPSYHRILGWIVVLLRHLNWVKDTTLLYHWHEIWRRAIILGFYVFVLVPSSRSPFPP